MKIKLSEVVQNHSLFMESGTTRAQSKSVTGQSLDQLHPSSLTHTMSVRLTIDTPTHQHQLGVVSGKARTSTRKRRVTKSIPTEKHLRETS
jgi:hypothetical protein